MTASHTSSGSAGAESFDGFVEKNFPTVYRFAFCMSLAADSAAALTQTAFARAQGARQHDATAALDKRWLLATLHHEWVAGGADARVGMRAEAASLADPLLKPKHVAGLDQAGVLGILHGMDEKLRLTLSLFYFEQLSYGEIAGILKIAPETVLAHLAEAKKVLRHQLEENRIEPAPPARPRVSGTKGRPGG